MGLLCHHASLTDHRRLYKTPRISLRDVGLQDPRSSAGFVHPTEDVDLPTAYGRSSRMDGLWQRSDGLPLVGYRVVPRTTATGVSGDDATLGRIDRQRKQAGI